MKKLSYLFFFIFINYCSLHAQILNWKWAKNSSQGINYAIEPRHRIAIDKQGNSYLTGAFTDSILTFGTASLTRNGFTNLYILKCDANANVIWLKGLSGKYDGESNSIAIDTNGNIYITGSFKSDSITFGSTVLKNYPPQFPNPAKDFFIAKFDPSGNVLWAKSAGGDNHDEGTNIKIDSKGNLIVSGYYFSKAIVFGPNNFTNSSLATNPKADIFIVKYDPSGTLIWAKNATGQVDDYIESIGLDALDNIYVTGYFKSYYLNLGNLTLTNTGANVNTHFFVAKYDSAGKEIWAKSTGGWPGDMGRGIVVEPYGNFYVTGSFYSPITFGTTTLTANGTQDIFIAKYDKLGNVVWAKNYGGTKEDAGSDINLDPDGNLYITGSFKSPTISFSSQLITNTNTFSDAFVAKCDSLGNFIWAKSWGGNDEDYCSSVIPAPNGALYLSGYFFSPSITLNTITLANHGFYDIYMAKLASNTGIINTDLQLCSDVVISPNPGNGHFNFICTNSIREIKVTNALGQIVYEAQPNEKEFSIDIHGSGIYSVTITSKNLINTSKLIVQ